MPNRPAIPIAIAREILTEVGHRCAVCGTPTPLEIAHIIPWRESKDHNLANLICLCANCHERADKEKWSPQVLRLYKLKPWNCRQHVKEEQLPRHTERIQVTIDMEFEKFDQKDQRWLQHAIAGFLEITPNSVQIVSLQKGSVKIIVELPESSAERLLDAFQRHDSNLLRDILPLVLTDLNRQVQTDTRTTLSDPLRGGSRMTPGKPSPFVGREKELDLFRTFINSPSQGVRVLSISGPGGSGKTWLLNEMAQQCAAENVTHLFLDFYDTTNRFWEGLIRNVVEALGANNFPKFKNALERYDQSTWSHEQAKHLWLEVEEQFVAEACALIANQPRPTVALLDTYEVLFDAGSHLWKDALRVLRSLNNIVIVLAGRTKIESPERFQDALERYEQIALPWFDQAETADYFARRCPPEQAKASPEFVKENIERIFSLSEGRPILVAVATDWVIKQWVNIPSDLARDRFEEFLYGFARQYIGDDLHRLTIDMSHLYRRFDKEVVERIQMRADPIPLHQSVENALEELGQYAFIKYRRELGQSCLLHDEWRTLMIRLFWKTQDLNGDLRRELSEAVVKYYYDWKIRPGGDTRDQQALQAERLYYQLHANLEQAFKEFKQTFETALQSYKLSFNELLLNEANAFAKDFSDNWTARHDAQLQLARARISYQQNEWRTAVAQCDALLSTAATQDVGFRAEVLALRGSTKRQLGDLPLALEDLNQALMLYTGLQDLGAIRDVNDTLGLTHRFLGNWDEAIRYYKASLKISKELDDKFKKARTLNNIGNVLRLKGRIASAIDYCERGLALMRELQQEREIGRILNTLGMIYRDQRSLDKAEANFEQAIAIFERKEDRRNQGRSLANLGHVYQRRGGEQLKLAEETLQQSQWIAENENDYEGLSYVLNKLGRVYRDQANWERAEDYFKRALALSEQYNNWYGVQDDLTDLCLLYAQNGQFDKMDVYAARAKELTQRHGHKLWAGRLEDALGDAALKQGNLDEAFLHYAEACCRYSEFDRNRYGEAIGKIKLLLLKLEPDERMRAIKILRDYWTRNGLNETHAGMPEMLERVEDIS